MTGDAASSDRVPLTAADRTLLEEARTATLATVGPDGQPRLVPICFVVDGDDAIWSPLDEKPKAVDDVHSLARVRDVLARDAVVLLVQRWSEDWSELAWLRLVGTASLADTPPAAVIAALRARYPQYASHDLEHRPALRIIVDRAQGWSATPA